jgi:hypothetical protein
MASRLLSRKALSLSDPQSSLQLAQEAPAFLQSQPASQPVFPLSLFSSPETPEKWINYEQLLLACLRTGDDKSAELCLERLTTRFGPANERVMGLRGLSQEAVAEDNRALEKILAEYEKVLHENPVNVVSTQFDVCISREKLMEMAIAYRETPCGIAAIAIAAGASHLGTG